MRVINNKCNIIFSRATLSNIYSQIREILRTLSGNYYIGSLSTGWKNIFETFTPLLLEYTHSQNISCSPIFPFGNKSFLASSVQAHHLPLYYDFYRQRIRKKGIKFRMNLQVGDPDPDFTFLHVPPRDSRDGISYNDATREEDWNCLPKIFSFFFSLSLNKFAIKMFHPTIRKKERRKI